MNTIPTDIDQCIDKSKIAEEYEMICDCLAYGEYLFLGNPI